ncbi:MAG: T9SS type A sorting domain-containing protein [Bacteroidetes bacterium]|nr:T9SS type A sorting domain-containing protein [Bacteroidota bacterium]
MKTHKFCRNFFLISILSVLHFIASGQEINSKSSEISKYIDVSDSLRLNSFNERKLPEEFRSMSLPAVIDNSTLPYFRPIFNQTGASCGQASGVAYNFTYEMCRKRDVSASDSSNQFPSHFVYNFMSYEGWYGVNYLHSFEILKTLGTPTVHDYGGIAIDDGRVWISGYDKYYQAMKNRIRSVEKIKTDTPEGLLTLKHWLAHHLEGASTGGVANFNSASPWSLVTLPEGTPEAGKKVIVQFPGNYATHAMTIVGYNDSIRYDYNSDGQFTNHLDINGDGIVDMRDWEIGGLKVANSYGDNWGDAGYFYMMYKLLAENIVDGGIWNHQVDILNVKEEYEPLLTLKLTIQHDRREQIRIMAGVSTDTANFAPDHLLSFPVFNFQGGPRYMQGGSSDPNKKTIEIGLDITPLLAYVESGEFADFYLEIHENDPLSEGSGEIIHYSIIDYNGNEAQEISCEQQNVHLLDNDITRLRVRHNPTFNKVKIETEQIPVFDAGYQMEATGGSEPLNWKLITPYHQQFFEDSFPEVGSEQLVLEAPNMKFARKTLDFSFPFYGETYNEVFVHKDGFILFEEGIFPWPYYKDTYLLFRSMKNISVFLFTPIKYYPGTKQAEGIWYEGNEHQAAFRWKQPLMYYDQHIGDGEFAVILFPDGKIEYYFNDILVNENVLWYSGVSAGNNSDFQLVKGSNERDLPQNPFRLVPENTPEGISISEEGFLSGMIENIENISNLCIKVIDDLGISDQKIFQISNDLRFDYKVVQADDSPPQNGSTVWAELTVTNVSSTDINNIVSTVTSNDPYLEIVSNQIAVGNLQAMSSITIPQAFEFSISFDCPDQHNIITDLSFVSNSMIRNGKMTFVSGTPEVNLAGTFIDDDENNRPDPGETFDLILNFRNKGGARAQFASAILTTNDTYVSFNEGNSAIIGDIPPGHIRPANYALTISPDCPIGHEIGFSVSVTDANNNQWNDTLSLSVGQFPLLVFNKAQNNLSASAIAAALDSLQIQYVYTTELPLNLDIYRAAIVCLGTYYTNTVLTLDEGAILSNYLLNGGKLYMEGSRTWRNDPQTAVHNKFNIQWLSITQAAYFNNFIGVNGSFTQNMNLPFSGLYNVLLYHLTFQPPAFPLFYTDYSPTAYTMIGFEGPGYKTIGSLFEFGSLGSPEDFAGRRNLMEEILAFFELEQFMVSIPENEITDASNSFHLSIRPNPSNGIVEIEFLSSEIDSQELKIYSVDGRLIKTILITREVSSEKLVNRWDGKDENGKLAPKGVYVVQIISGQKMTSSRIIRI